MRARRRQSDNAGPHGATDRARFGKLRVCFFVALTAGAVSAGLAVVRAQATTLRSVGAPTPIVAIEKPTSTTVARALPRTPADAALQLFFAWQRADRPAAAPFATVSAADGLFGYPLVPAAALTFRGCTQPAGGRSTCSWVRAGGGLTMEVSAPATAAAVVQTVVLS